MLGECEVTWHDSESFAQVTTNEWALVSFRVVASTERGSRATVRISRNSHDYTEAEAEGIGPMDAIFRAIDAALRVCGEVAGIRINAFPDYGLLGKARIRVNFEGREYSGRGSSPDAVEAAAHAYLRAAVFYLEEQSPPAKTK